MMQKIATINPDNVTVGELAALDTLLNSMSDEFEGERREGDLIEFLTYLSETLKQGETVHLYSVEKS